MSHLLQVSKGDDEIEEYITKLEDFFECTKAQTAGENTTKLEEAFDKFQASFESLVSPRTPSDQK